MLKRQLISLGIIALCGFAVLAPESVMANTRLESQRADFRGAMKALQKGQLSKFHKLHASLHDYPLYGYLEYRFLAPRLHNQTEKRMDDFFLTQGDTPSGKQLRKGWLKELARRGRWESFLKNYQPGTGKELHCYYLQARIQTGSLDKARPEIEETWLVGESLPRACDPVFNRWLKAYPPSPDLVWQRIALAMKNRKLSLATYLGKLLDDSERVWVNRWQQMHRYPKRELAAAVYKDDTARIRQIVLHGITRLARIDAESAHQELQRFITTHHFNKTELAETEKYIAVRAAYQKKPQAYTWLAGLDASVVDDKVNDWRLRTALDTGSWSAIVAWYAELDEKDRNSPRWLYWQARALEQLGDHASANNLYASVAKQRDYHGFLAADRLQLPYSLNYTPITYTEQEITDIEAQPGIARAREFFKLGLLYRGRVEWNHATASMNERQLQLAAVLAHRLGWHDRAVLTVAKAKHFDDLEMRFPIVYRNQVEHNAKRNQIDPAWVFGVLRQESAYMADARSHAGAMGLMQLMPGTARRVGRLIKSPVRRNQELLDVDRNIRLGTVYLKRMLEKNNHNEVLATASYNAGPQRVQQWLPKSDNESADIWVETIPFNETRKYVRRVLAYTAIFEKQLGRPMTPLHARMPEVEAAK